MKKIFLLFAILISTFAYSQRITTHNSRVKITDVPNITVGLDSLVFWGTDQQLQFVKYSDFLSKIETDITTITALDDLTDVILSTPANQEILTYNGTNWINQVFTAGSETDPIYAAWDKSTGISITESQVSDLVHTTDTNIDQAGIEGYGFVTGPHTDEADVIGWGFIKGSDLNDQFSISSTYSTLETDVNKKAIVTGGDITLADMAGVTAEYQIYFLNNSSVDINIALESGQQVLNGQTMPSVIGDGEYFYAELISDNVWSIDYGTSGGVQSPLSFTAPLSETGDVVSFDETGFAKLADANIFSGTTNTFKKLIVQTDSQVTSGSIFINDLSTDVFEIKSENNSDMLLSSNNLLTLSSTEILLSGTPKSSITIANQNAFSSNELATNEWIRDYISNQNETDPVYINDPAFSIVAGDIINLSNLEGVNSGDQDVSIYQTKDLNTLSKSNYTTLASESGAYITISSGNVNLDKTGLPDGFNQIIFNNSGVDINLTGDVVSGNNTSIPNGYHATYILDETIWRASTPIEGISGGQSPLTFNYPLEETNEVVTITQTGVESLGFVAGAHTIDTNIDKLGIEAFGFVDGAHTTDTNLSDGDIAAFGYIKTASGNFLPLDMNIAIKTADYSTDVAENGYLIKMKTGAGQVNLNASGKNLGFSQVVYNASGSDVDLSVSLSGNNIEGQNNSIPTGYFATYVLSETNKWTVSTPSASQTGGTDQTLAIDGFDLTISGVGGNTITIPSSAVADLNDLTDVTIVSPTNGDVLKFNGSVWAKGVDIDTNTQLVKQDILDMNFYDGPHTINTDTQLSQAQVGIYATNEGFIKTWRPISTGAGQTLIGSTEQFNLNATGILSLNESAGNVTISHLAGSGYYHIPSGGTVGQIIVNTATGQGSWQDQSGAGDMYKVNYDSNDDGIVNNSDLLGGVASSSFARTDILETFDRSLVVNSLFTGAPSGYKSVLDVNYTSFDIINYGWNLSNSRPEIYYNSSYPIHSFSDQGYSFYAGAATPIITIENGVFTTSLTESQINSAGSTSVLNKGYADLYYNGLKNIVEDITPELGGHLSLNGFNFDGEAIFTGAFTSNTGVIKVQESANNQYHQILGAEDVLRIRSANSTGTLTSYDFRAGGALYSNDVARKSDIDNLSFTYSKLNKPIYTALNYSTNTSHNDYYIILASGNVLLTGSGKSVGFTQTVFNDTGGDANLNLAADNDLEGVNNVIPNGYEATYILVKDTSPYKWNVNTPTISGGGGGSQALSFSDPILSITDGLGGTVNSVDLSALGGGGTGTVTSVSTSDGLTTGGTATDPIINVNFDGLGNSGTLIGSDKLVSIDGTASKKTTISTIPLSIFNNDIGWTANIGDITSVTAGSGLTGGGTVGALTMSIDPGNGIGVGNGNDPNNLFLTTLSDNWDAGSVFTITAAGFYEGSLSSLKMNIQPFVKSGLDLINGLRIVSYDKKDDGIKDKIGILIDESMEEFANEDHTAVDLYKTIFVQAKAIQELSAKLDALEKRVKKLENE